MKILDSQQVLESLKESHKKRSADYYAMYSSWLGGVTTDTALMTVPVDDHIVHRGDGVFEALRMKKGEFYLMKDHLDRLERSANLIGLPMSHSKKEIKDICYELRDLAHQQEAYVRIYMSRGPGSFTPNPYDTVGSQLYVVLTKFKAVSEEKYTKGASAKYSRISIKSDFFPTAKTCNYLPNVLMKKESLDGEYDFSIGLNDKSFVSEGPTENIMIVNAQNELVIPNFDYILKGTTMVRAFALADELINQGLIDLKVQRDISKQELESAKEILVIGTTYETLAITQFEGKPVGNGQPGPVALKLRELIQVDMS